MLSVEHPAAASITAISLQLAIDGDTVALAKIDRHLAEPALPIASTAAAAVTASPTVEQRISAHLAAASAPLTAEALRKLCRIRDATLTAALTDLVAASRVRKDPAGYVIAR